MLARSPRSLALWSAAVAVAAGTAVLVASDLATLHRRAATFGPERSTVVATHRLDLGVVLDRSDLRARRVHRTQLPPGVLGHPSDAVGRVVTVPVVRGGFVATDNLAPRRRTGLDGALPIGTRAMRIVVSEALRPPTGAAVDVYASSDTGVQPADPESIATAAVVAAGVQVLRVDSTTSSDGRRGLGITVLVSPHQARSLAFAMTNGQLSVALVPPEEARAP